MWEGKHEELNTEIYIIDMHNQDENTVIEWKQSSYCIYYLPVVWIFKKNAILQTE